VKGSLLFFDIFFKIRKSNSSKEYICRICNYAAKI